MVAEDESRAPLLSDAASHQTLSRPQNNDNEAVESSPLLPRDDSDRRYDGQDDEAGRLPSPAATSLQSIKDRRSLSPKALRRPWAVVIAIVLLVSAAIAITFGAYIAPAAVEEYAKQAMVIEPTDLSIDSFTANGVRARIRANFKFDASRVKDENVRNIGRAGTWIAHKIESQETQVRVYLPEYDNLLLGVATVPSILVNIRNGETNKVDFVADLVAGEAEGMKRIANDWLEGRLGRLRVQGNADIALKSGFLSLGTTTISDFMVFEGNDIPAVPAYNITSLNFHEIDLPSGRNGVGADASMTIFNKYPVRLTVPSLAFDILVPNCKPDQPFLTLADATTSTIKVEPKQEVEVRVESVVTKISRELLSPCPSGKPSPLDIILGNYIHGKDVSIFVRGSSKPSGNIPSWITEIISNFLVSVPFPGHEFNDAIKNFTLANVQFELPNPFADPGSPEADYRVSGNIRVLAAMPKEMNFAMNVSQVRANADVYYKGKKLGYLDLKTWQAAKSQRYDATPEQEAVTEIESQIKDAPLRITDEDVFSDMMGEYLIGGKTLILSVKALVDVKVDTVLGEFVIRDLPGEGKVPVKAPKKGDITDLLPKISNIDIVDTGPTSLTIEARINFTNPTEYSAKIPFASIYIESNGSVIAEGTVNELDLIPGENTNVLVRAVWDPRTLGGVKGATIGRQLMSQYISGINTTLTFRTHIGTVPSQPGLGRALSRYNITIPTPHLFDEPNQPDDGDQPSDPDSGEPKFIRDATFHLLSSTAQFALLSPLRHSTIFIENIHGTAFYNHTEPVGNINYDYPFKVDPGITTSPRIPVEWSLDSVGYEKVRRALGGDLKLDAEATVNVRLGRWSEKVWYKGGGIGAKVRL